MNYFPWFEFVVIQMVSISHGCPNKIEEFERGTKTCVLCGKRLYLQLTKCTLDGYMSILMCRQIVEANCNSFDHLNGHVDPLI